jgi:hypothetical protein
MTIVYRQRIIFAVVQFGDVLLEGACLEGAGWDPAQLCLTTEMTTTRRSLGRIRARPGDIRWEFMKEHCHEISGLWYFCINQTHLGSRYIPTDVFKVSFRIIDMSLSKFIFHTCSCRSKIIVFNVPRPVSAMMGPWSILNKCAQAHQTRSGPTSGMVRQPTQAPLGGRDHGYSG